MIPTLWSYCYEILLYTHSSQAIGCPYIRLIHSSAETQGSTLLTKLITVPPTLYNLSKKGSHGRNGERLDQDLRGSLIGPLLAVQWEKQICIRKRCFVRQATCLPRHAIVGAVADACWRSSSDKKRSSWTAASREAGGAGKTSGSHTGSRRVAMYIPPRFYQLRLPLSWGQLRLLTRCSCWWSGGGLRTCSFRSCYCGCDRLSIFKDLYLRLLVQNSFGEVSLLFEEVRINVWTTQSST